MKCCSKCLVDQPTERFNKNRSTPDGLHYHCKGCRSEYSLANRSKKSEAYKSWYRLHADEQRAKARQYRLDNLEEVNKRLDAWRKANGLRMRHHRHERRARMKNNGVFLVTKRDLKRILNNPCAYCGKSGKVELDHVLPIDKGGRHSIGNLVAACPSCNRSKNNRLLVQWKTAGIGER